MSTRIRFTRTFSTVAYGDVKFGDVVEVADADADRYIRNDFAEAAPEPKPKPKRAARRSSDGG